MNTTEFDPTLLYGKYNDIRTNIYYDITSRLDCDPKKFKGKFVYVAGPVSGIDNYKENFDQVVSFLKSDERFKDDIIINPIELIKKHNTTDDYMIGCFISIYLVNNFADVLVLDDRTDLWKQSRGTLIELTQALNWSRHVLSFKKLQEDNYDIR